MDARERQRIQKMSESISLPEDEMRKLQVSLEIELGGGAEHNAEELKRIAQEEERQQQEELQELLTEVKRSNPDLEADIPGPGKKEGPMTPFAIEQEAEIREEITQEAEIVPVERMDTKVALRISEDKLHAYISLTPAQGGGRTPNVKILENYLKKKGVTYGINKKKLQQVVNEVTDKANPVTDFEIATGKEMEQGTESSIAVKFQQATADDFEGDIDTEGAICFGTVEKNDVLLEITPAQMGRSGFSVTGEELKPPELKNTMVATRQHTRRAGDKIIAEKEGLVFYYPDSILVKPYADARITIVVAEDRMSASMTLTPAVGDGQRLTRELVEKALKNRKITTGINEQTIIDAVEKCETEKAILENVPVARGVPALNGTDGRLVFKVKLHASHQFKSTGKDQVDFREKDSIININQGTLLALHFPAQPKEQDGMDVFGNTIPAADGIPVELKISRNIEARENNKGVMEYYAKMDGQVLFENNTLDMESLFVVNEDLSLETGNIDFLGNVLIKGNVEDKFIIKAGGDIEIRGNVGASVVHAGRDVYVKGGVINRGNGEIRAGRNVVVRFAEASHIIAKENLSIDRAVLNSEIAAGDTITCKKEKGQIIGGHSIARNRIDVNELGTQAGTKTSVTLGVDFFKLEQLTMMSSEQRRFLTAQEKIDEVLKKLEKYEETNGVLEGELQKTYIGLMQKKVLVQKKLHEIRKRLLESGARDETIPEGEIIVRKTLHSDVHINMGKHAEKTTLSRDKQRIYADRETGKVSFEPWVMIKA